MTLNVRSGDGIWVALETPDPDRDVEREPVDSGLETQAVPNAMAGLRRGRPTVIGVGQVDTGQVTQGMRDQDGYLPHDDVRAGTSASGTKLKWDGRQVPADGFAVAGPS